MNKMELFEAVGEIDSDLIIRCENEAVHAPKQTWVRWLSAVACLCLVVLCVFILPISKPTPNTPVAPGNSSQPATPDDVSLHINRLEQKPVFQNAAIALMVNDYVPMTDDEFLNYYGVSFGIGEAVPALALQPQNPAYSNGVYKNGNRGTYYDSHTFAFANDANTRRLEITLGKTACYPGLVVGAGERDVQLEQSEISGFAVTVFQYADENGSTCFYTEFLNSGIAYCITSYNLSQEDYAAALASVIADNVKAEAKKSGAEDTHTLTGTVTAVDGSANLIFISSGGGAFSSLKVCLPDGEAKSYSIGDKVEVSYTGNPFTICTIWERQVNSIAVVKN